VLVTGNTATSALGTVTTATSNTIPVTGFAGTSAVGTVTVIAKAVVVSEGVSATGITPRVNVWGLVPDSQTPNWKEVA